jgi:hypothetical protein
LLQRYNYLHPAAAEISTTRIVVENRRGAWMLPGIGCAMIDLPAESSIAAAPRVDGDDEQEATRPFRHTTQTVKPVRPEAQPGSPVVDFALRDFALSDDAGTYAAIAAENYLVQWNANSLALGPTWNSNATAMLTGKSELTCLDHSGNHLVIGRRDGLGVVCQFGATCKPTFHRLAASEIACIDAVKSTVAFGTRGGRLYICRMPSLEVLERLSAYDGAVCTVAMSDDGRLLASGSDAGELLMFYRQNDKYETVLRLLLRSPIRKLDFDDAGSRLLIATDDTLAVQCWNLTQLQTRLAALGLGW